MSNDYEKMPIPFREDGEANFQAIAKAILDQARNPSEPTGAIAVRYPEQLEVFQFRYPGDGKVEVRRSCLAGRFCASLFMELQHQALGLVTDAE